MFWCDEGSGTILYDISENKNQIKFYKEGKKLDDDSDIWSEQLSSGIPMDIEDEWGNWLPFNWAIKLP